MMIEKVLYCGMADDILTPLILVPSLSKLFIIDYFDDVMGILVSSHYMEIYTLKMRDFRELIVKCPTYADNLDDAKIKVLDKIHGSRFIHLTTYEKLLDWRIGFTEIAVYITEIVLPIPSKNIKDHLFELQFFAAGKYKTSCIQNHV